MKKKVYIFGMITTIALLLAACAPKVDPAASLAADDSPQVESLILEGYLAPANSLDQFFTMPGRVAEVLVQDGEMVTLGQELVRLEESPDALAVKMRAEQEFLAAQQALEDLKQGAEVALAQARMDLIAAEQALENAQENFADDASDENQAALQMAEAKLKLTQEAARRLESADGLDPDLLAAAEARLASAQAAVEAAQAALDARTLRASMAGTVVDLTMRAGQWVSAGAPVITIADLETWVVKTSNLTEADVVRIEPGMTVNITLDALPAKTIPGQVTHINARFEEKRGEITYTATIALTQSEPLQRWGMTAAVRFLP